MKRIIQRAMRTFGYEISKSEFGDDLDPELRKHISAAQPYTLTSPARMVALLDSIIHAGSNNIPGDIVECGVWKGGSMMLAAFTLLSMQEDSRNLYLYDTFDGMPPPTEFDVSYDGKSAERLLKADPGKTGVGCRAGIEEVRNNMARTGYPASKIHYIQGKVEDTIPGHLPERIAILRLDTDWYESTRHELEHLYPRLASGGILIVDDYGHWRGARQAVDEYLSLLQPKPFLHRIDYTGRLLVKP